MIFNKVLLLRAGEGGMRTSSRQKGGMYRKRLGTSVLALNMTSESGFTYRSQNLVICPIIPVTIYLLGWRWRGIPHFPRIPQGVVWNTVSECPYSCINHLVINVVSWHGHWRVILHTCLLSTVSGDTYNLVSVTAVVLPVESVFKISSSIFCNFYLMLFFLFKPHTEKVPLHLQNFDKSVDAP